MYNTHVCTYMSYITCTTHTCTYMYRSYRNPNMIRRHLAHIHVCTYMSYITCTTHACICTCTTRVSAHVQHVYPYMYNTHVYPIYTQITHNTSDPYMYNTYAYLYICESDVCTTKSLKETKS
jgi:hypothetical protein